MNISEHSFIAHPEKGQVSALLAIPPEAKALIVLGHGAGAGMRHQNMEHIAQALGQHQIASFRYQFPYMERGGGRDSQKVSLSTVREAVITASTLGTGLPLLAGGHSFGGRMTSLAAAEEVLPEVRGLIFFAFPLHAPGRPGNERAAHLPDIQIPMLFLSGSRDTFMTHDLFQPILDKIGDRAQMHQLHTASHGYKILKRTGPVQKMYSPKWAGLLVPGWMRLFCGKSHFNFVIIQSCHRFKS